LNNLQHRLAKQLRSLNIPHKIGNNQILFLTKWKNNQFINLSFDTFSSGSLYFPLDFFVINDTVYLLEYHQIRSFIIWKLNNTKWEVVGETSGDFIPLDQRLVKDKLWIIDYERKTSKQRISYWTINNYYNMIIPITNFPSDIIKIESSENKLYFLGSFSEFNNTVFNHICCLDFSSSISGIVYWDKTPNCINDSTDTPLFSQDIGISCDKNIFNWNSYKSGFYTIYTDTGQLKIFHSKSIIDKWKYFCLNSCNIDTYTIKIDTAITLSGYDFAFVQKSNIVDVKSSVNSFAGNRFLSGGFGKYLIKIENIGSVIVDSLVVTLEINKNLIIKNSTPHFEKNIGNLIFWKIKNLDVLTEKDIFIELYDSSVSLIGDTFKIIVHSQIVLNDIDLFNNQDSLIQIVSSSFDPNDKQSNPSGRILKNTKKIDYQINFQNTGNDTAYKVLVVDTVDTKSLSIKNLTINTSSHPFRIKILNNVIIWTFDNILLPDSHTNEVESHGFIRYSVDLKEGMNVGDSILNKAYIYFDYQKPIITNVAWCVLIDSVISVENKFIANNNLNIYPNPASNYLTISSDNQEIKEIILFDLNGKIIRKIVAPNVKGINISFEGISSGYYLVFVKTIHGTYKSKILINQIK